MSTGWKGKKLNLFNKWRNGEGASAPILTPAHQSLRQKWQDPYLCKDAKNWTWTNAMQWWCFDLHCKPEDLQSHAYLMADIRHP